MTLKLQGIWSPMPTPFDSAGAVDEARLRQLVDHLIEGGVDGLFPLGTTGEFALLSREERKRVVEVVVEACKGRVSVLAGVSDPWPRNVIQYAEDAADVGADGIVATTPYYYSVGPDGLYDHFRMIYEAVSLPLVLYNIPEWTHNFVPPEVVVRLVEEKMIVGMKYTEYNFLNLMRFISAVGKDIAVFTGSDAMTCSCLEFGGRGAVISVSNILPKKASSIFDLLQDGKREEAVKVQRSILPAIEAAGIGKFPAGLKEAMKVAGFPVGEVRPPQTPLTEAEKAEVKRLVSEAAAE